MSQRSDRLDSFTRDVLSRQNRKRAVGFLIGALRDPLKDIVMEAAEELEAESSSTGQSGRGTWTQLILLSLLGGAASIYLANRRRGETPAEAPAGQEQQDQEQGGESRREEIAAGVGTAGTQGTETSGGDEDTEENEDE